MPGCGRHGNAKQLSLRQNHRVSEDWTLHLGVKRENMLALTSAVLRKNPRGAWCHLVRQTEVAGGKGGWLGGRRGFGARSCHVIIANLLCIECAELYFRVNSQRRTCSRALPAACYMCMLTCAVSAVGLLLLSLTPTGCKLSRPEVLWFCTGLLFNSQGSSFV